jgi:hypothetical protein
MCMIDADALRVASNWVISDTENAARRAVLAAANAPTPAPCPHCGKPMDGATPAAPVAYDASGDRGVAPVKDANVAGEPPPSGYMSREKLL